MSAPDTTALLIQQLLLLVLVPVWLLAGLGDWLCHRVQHIEHSAGLKESLLHLLMLAEMGIAVGAALLLQINAAVLVLMLTAGVAHELTTWWDLAYAQSRRVIPPLEQWVHSLQIVLPWTALIALALVHRDQALAVIGLGTSAADWQWRLKNPPLPAGHVAAVAAGALLLVGLPFAEECRRCWRVRAGATDQLRRKCASR
jgi:hypothetical protein